MSKYNKNEENLTRELMDVGVFSIKLLWEASKFIVKNTPKAIVTVAQVKREIVDALSEEIGETQKKIKEDKLEEKIRHMKRGKEG